MPERSSNKVFPNPFVYARALLPEESIDRAERMRLLELAEGGHNTVLHAPRRFGKTTLLKQVLQGAEVHGAPGVLVDLSDVLSVADVSARLEQAFRALPGDVRRLVGKELGGIAMNTPIAGMSVTRRDPPTDPIHAVHTLLELPARIADRHGRRVLVVLDEFQALIALEGMDGVFRSHIQHHSEVSYIFAGSEPSLLRTLFEDRARPLYGQAARLRLGRLDGETAYDFLEGRFEHAGKDASAVIGDLLYAADGHPQRLMLIAHQLWDLVGSARRVEVEHLRGAHDAAMRAVEPELRYLWDGLAPNDRRVLAALASGLSPYQHEALQLMGLASGSSASLAVETLENRAIVERDDDERLRILDPLLARWVRRNGGARAQVYVIRGEKGWIVADGPSLAFVRSTHQTLVEAQSEADRIVAGGRGGDVMIYDTDDPNDLPDWAVRPGVVE